MTKRTENILKLAFICFTVGLCAVLIAVAAAEKTKSENPEKWIIKSYGNNVALYSGDEIIEVYGAIRLDTLPESDRKTLDSGIAFVTKEEAQSAIEDYDG